MKFRISNILAVVGVLAILIILQFSYLVIQISNPLQKEVLSKYDAIVILSGNPMRAEFGSKLFRDGRSAIVLLSKEGTPVNNYLEPHNKSKEYELYLKILTKNKVPKQSIRLFGDDNKSTFDEAKSLTARPYRDLNNLLVVTNKYHVFRAQLIFKQLLPQRSIDFIFPEIYNENDIWWKNKYSIQIILLEVFKTIFFYIFSNFDNYLMNFQE